MIKARASERPHASGTEKPMLAVLAGRTGAPPPIWLMRQAGRYLPEYRAVRAKAKSFLELCFTPELAVEVTLQPIRRFAFDAAILFSDILVVPHALGQNVAFREGEGPVLAPLRSKADIAALSEARLSEVLTPVYETVRRVAAALPRGTALIGFAGAPWTVATYMVEGGTSRDFHHAKLMAYREPAMFAELIDRLTQTTAAYLLGQIAAGAEIIQLFDSWAGVLPETAFERWVIAPTRRIVESVRAVHPGFPIIGFPRGAGALYRRYVAETGVTAISLDTCVPLETARELQALSAVQGNLDPLLLVAGGAAMRDAVSRILAMLSNGPFIFNLGHGIVPETPPEHVAELVTLVRHG